MEKNGITNRSLALDALRGIAIIGMVLSGTIAHTLPAWMYHAQVGPRSGMKFDQSFVGITWVDLVFPFFLFAMGAAFPLAMGRKLDNGVKPASLLAPIFKRAFLLAFFAIAIYHCTPYRLSGNWNYALAMLAFVLFFASFIRFRILSEKKNSLVNWVGIGLLALLIAFNVASQPDVFKSGFKLSHNDIIILVLANMAVFGAILWIYTRSNLMARLAVLALLLALRAASGTEDSINKLIWHFNPMQLLPENFTALLYENKGWLYRMEFLKYLSIVVPGTIAGDLILKWINTADEKPSGISARKNMVLFTILMPSFVISNLVCLYARFLYANLIINLLLSAAGFVLLKHRTSATEAIYFKLFRWGTFWLLLGTFFEAFEGGIRKDSATFSYFFVTSGLAIFTFLFFSLMIDYFGRKGLFRYLSECGQNPMLAYVAGTFFVVPMLVFTGLMPAINKLHEITPWFGLLKGLIITGGMMAVTVISVRKKWFWKT